MPRIYLVLLLWGAGGIAHAAATVLIFGDSISAGYGLARGTGWVDLLQQRLEHEKYDYKVINASLSGETTAGGKNRINSALTTYKPTIVILELGANDGLRGAKTESIVSNLTSMIAASRIHGSKVLLVGMQLPPNYGNAYTEKFSALYPALARSQRIALVPFIYQGFATDRAAFQADGIHPNAASQALMLANVWPHLQPLLARHAKP